MSAPTPKTVLELVAAALKELRVLRADESPSAHDRADVEAAYVGLYAELANIGVAFWDQGSIPLLAFRPLARLLAAEVAQQYGKSYAAGDAMARLKAAAAKPDDSGTTRRLYY